MQSTTVKTRAENSELLLKNFTIPGKSVAMPADSDWKVVDVHGNHFHATGRRLGHLPARAARRMSERRAGKCLVLAIDH